MSGVWKITPTDADAIRTAHESGAKVSDLAAQYGVSAATIYNHLRPKARVQPPASRVTAVTAIPYPDATKGYVPRSCNVDRCGQPPAADLAPLPLVVYGTDIAMVEVCSWHCLSRHAIRRELAGGDTAPDPSREPAA